VGEGIRRRIYIKPVRREAPSKEDESTERPGWPSDEKPERHISDESTAAAAPGGSQETTGAAAQPDEHGPKSDEHDRKKSSRIGYWILILLFLAAGSGLVAYKVGHQEFFSGDKLPNASGGLLIFTDQGAVSHISASVAAETFYTGFPGISTLALHVSLTNAHAGVRWYIAASGQYEPKINMPLGAFCYDASASRSGSTITCRDIPSLGFRNMAYDFRDRIGVINGRSINEAVGVQGYDYAHTVVVSGTLTKSYKDEPNSLLTTVVYIPIQSPKPTQIGSDRYFTFASIATVYSGDFGSGARLATLKGRQTSATFADSRARAPVDSLTINSLTFIPEIDSAESQISWASPPTIRPDQLIWRSTGQGIGPINFTLHNPFEADALSRDSFIAGIFVSIAASALLLLLEKIVEWRIARPKNRMIAHSHAGKAKARWSSVRRSSRSSRKAPTAL
jgi:hypothetical protein